MSIKIRRFEKSDIPYKVRWVNDSENHQYLHYDLPLETEKTEKWYEGIKDRCNRYDATVTCDGIPVGVIGLLEIDSKNKKAEFYILIGEKSYKGKGIATQASKLILEYAFDFLNLNKIYLYTETSNIPAQKLFEKVGFVQEGKLKDDLFYNGKFVDRFIYSISRATYFERYCSLLKYTPIIKQSKCGDNEIYIKHEELFPYSFGGNKARKAIYFFNEIDSGSFDCVVTYGSSSSNHCRVIANMAAKRKMKCVIISPEEESRETYNRVMMDIFGAEVITVPIKLVHDTIDKTLDKLTNLGYKPFFVPGGGHGNFGAKAYVDCFHEIKQFEKSEKMKFDYIFHASGTGTTQAGLICGKIIEKDAVNIVGISIARKNPYGRNVVINSVKEYLSSIEMNFKDEEIDEAAVFEDFYIENGYGKGSKNINNVIKNMMTKYGIPMDTTYVGKAYAGMLDYIKRHNINGKNILFIHTGGTPLFFNDLEKLLE